MRVDGSSDAGRWEEEPAGLTGNSILGLAPRRWLPAILVALAMAAPVTGILGCGPRAGSQEAGVTATAAPHTAPPSTTTVGLLPVPSEPDIPSAVAPQELAFVTERDWLALAQTFDSEQALAELTALCWPEFAGRLAGSDGGRRAAEYIAGRFADLGLLPGGEDGTYWQEFAVPLVELVATPALTLTTGSGECVPAQLGRDFRPIAGNYVGAGAADGRVIWVNRGAHSDYDGVDASGAVVVCRFPPADDAFRQAAEHRAAGLLIVSEDAAALQMARAARDTSWISATIPAAYVTPDVVGHLLAGSDTSYEDLSIQYTPLVLPGHAAVTVAMREVEAAPARNVLGVLPGRDPARRQEIVILGAHYDHLGSTPDGTFFHGANDDASGVAVLLEIARTWQEAGFLPKRTVLFAAWDAEEEGLLGSTHYVAEPLYPLTATVAMLQLDMVGAGEAAMLVDGDGLVQEQAFASAAELGIATGRIDMGGSDHVPFREQQIPASLLIWSEPEGGYPTYHRATDTPASLDVERLGKAGALAGLVALHLSTTQPELEDLIGVEAQALRTGDPSRWLPLVSQASQRQEQDRFACWAQLGAEDADLSLASLVAASDMATATVRLRYLRGPDPSPQRVEYQERFIREGGGWRYAGRANTLWNGAKVQLLAPPTTGAGEAFALVSAADSLYGQLEQALTLTDTRSISLELLASASDLQVLAGSPSNPDCASLGGIALLASCQALTQTVVNEALSRAGLPRGELTWLRTGLAALLQSRLPNAVEAQEIELCSRDLAQATDQLWSLAELPEVGAVPSERLPAWRAQASSLAAYLLETGGWPAVARLARASGDNISFDAACRAALGYPCSELEARWHRETVERWAEVTTAISATLRARSQALLLGDRTALAATLNPANPTLRGEQQQWLDQALAHRVTTYDETGILEELSDREALVTVTRVVEPADGSEPLRETGLVRFVLEGDRWLFDGRPSAARSTTHVTILYDPDARLAEPRLDGILADGERALALLRADHPSLPQRIVVRLHSSGGSFRFSAPLPSPEGHERWSNAGDIIDLDLTRAPDPGYALAGALAQQALHTLGVADPWLLEGASAVAQETYSARTFNEELLQRRRNISAALRAHKELDLASLASWPAGDDREQALFQDQAWDMVRYVARQCGQEAWWRALTLRGQGASLDEAFRQATGHTLAALLTDWHQSALSEHLDAAFVAFAQGFDGQRALSVAQRLGAREFDGRASGTAGADAAAQFVAEQFQALGLAPAGDDGSYLQRFPISSTHLLTTPSLSVTDAAGRRIRSLSYPQEFRELVRGYAGGGEAEGEVVWVTEADCADARLGGRIVIERLRGDAVEAVEMAYCAGAGGLILVREDSLDLRLRSRYLPSLQTATFPVVEISNGTFVALVKASGQPITVLSTEKPVLRLGLRAHLSVPLEVEPEDHAANVLALLPGSDERLKGQVVIVGAHYDHVGSLPDGTLYPGANDDASGVGVLLELARLCRQSGWQPRRSILFAAWGAEEMGLLGSSYYVSHPVVPLAQTVAMIQLDMVGDGKGYYLDIHADRASAGELVAALVLGAEEIDVRVSQAAPEYASDSAPFAEREVPAALLMWRDAGGIHLPSDSPDRLDPAKLAVTGKTTAAAVRWLAD